MEDLIISATSWQSMKNELLEAERLSELDRLREFEYQRANLFILVKILSTIPNAASCAGTKLPIWARMTIIPTCFKNTLFPEAFGPIGS